MIKMNFVAAVVMEMRMHFVATMIMTAVLARLEHLKDYPFV